MINSYWCSTKINSLKKLLRCNTTTVLMQKCGGNSTVYCVEADGEKFAVKTYPVAVSPHLDRLNIEIMTYKFLNEQCVPSIPVLKAYCRTEGWLITSWITGDLPKTYSVEDIAQAIDFIRNIASLNMLPAAVHFTQAAEACLSLTELIRQIKWRFQRLLGVARNGDNLHIFLTSKFLEIFVKIQLESIAKCNKYTSHETVLPTWQRSLIPADFGFHNTLKGHDGILRFFDFDYFGWDDPVKLLSDILWHPKMSLSLTQKYKFIDGLANIYDADQMFLPRLNYTLPLFGLRWILIMLNDFIPEYWTNRQHSKPQQTYDEAKNLQFTLANQLLDDVPQMAGILNERICTTSN